MKQKASLYFCVGSFLLVVGVFLKNGWVADDAYIIFRSIEQLFSGNGPVWNPHERVQVSTSPLWYLLLSLVRLFSSDPFLNVIGLSLVLLVSSVFVLRKIFGDSSYLLLVVLLWVSSNAFFDYTSSGLENVLAYTIIISYLLTFIRFTGEGSFAEIGMQKNRLRLLMILFGLAICVRHDLLFLLLAPSVYLGIRNFKVFTAREWLCVLFLAFLPFGFFTLYSTIYYGFPFPNTAYAKLSTGISSSELIVQGAKYFRATSSKDSITLLVMLLALGLNLLKPCLPSIRVICLARLSQLAGKNGFFRAVFELKAA